MTTPRIWILHPGTALQARYTPHHTFRVQIKGSARYILMSPSCAQRNAYLYPYLHLSHGQSQVDFSDSDIETMPLFQDIEVQEVKVLNPGEVKKRSLKCICLDLL